MDEYRNVIGRLNLCGVGEMVPMRMCEKYRCSSKVVFFYVAAYRGEAIGGRIDDKGLFGDSTRHNKSVGLEGA